MKKVTSLLLALSLFAFQTGLALAADIEIKQPSEVKILQLGTVISGLVGLAMIIAALLAFIYLVWGGIEWIGSGGDKAGLEAARNRITNAFVGLFIVAAAWAITKLIETFFGITIISKGISIPKAY